ncbi:MAG: hypothetical protein V1889_03670 [archaeon]
MLINYGNKSQKIQTNNKHAHIGPLGIYDYKSFWDAFKENKEIITGEIQVSNGLQKLKEIELKAKIFTWYNNGTPNSYEHAKKNYPYGESYCGK